MSARSVSPKTTMPFRGSAALPHLERETEADRPDTPFPPPLPPASSSSRPDILLKIATPYDADAYDSFLDRDPELRH